MACTGFALMQRLHSTRIKQKYGVASQDVLTNKSINQACLPANAGSVLTQWCHSPHCERTCIHQEIHQPIFCRPSGSISLCCLCGIALIGCDSTSKSLQGFVAQAGARLI
jgi:hypothetical protein